MGSIFKNILLLALIIGIGYYVTTHKVFDTVSDIQSGSISSKIVSFIKNPGSISLPTLNSVIGNLGLPSFGGTGAGDGTIPASPAAPEPIPVSTKSGTAAASTKSTTSAQTPGAVVNTITPTSPKAFTDGNLTVAGIIKETNIRRTQNGAVALTENSKLDASAQTKADDIIKRQYFAHVAPDGTTVTNLITNQGYTYIQIGENLALGQFTSDNDVVTAWMNSPEHKKNMLDTHYQEIGIGVAYGLYNGHYVYAAVQHFGRPSSSCPTLDQDLKQKVTDGQAELVTLNQSLTSLKGEIDAGTAAGRDESVNVSSYNAGVAKYQTMYAQVEELRVEYNSEVNAYNTCINAK